MAYLVVRAESHGSETVDVFFELVEEILPSLDEFGLVLIVDQLDLVDLPRLAHLDNNAVGDAEAMDSLVSGIPPVPFRPEPRA